MDFLSRNKALLDEIAQAYHIAPGSERGRSDKLVFYSAGSYRSPVLGREVYIGVKQFTGGPEYNHYPRQSFKSSLKFVLAAQRGAPGLLPMLPSFFGLIESPDATGIITEDLSHNGTRLFGPKPPCAPVPEEFWNISQSKLDAACCFFWGEAGRRQPLLADFDHVTLLDEYDVDAPEELLGAHTLHIDYPLFKR